MIKVFFQCFLLLLAIKTNAQSNTDSAFDFNRKFAVPSLKNDLKTLRDSLEILHPALYRYTTKNKLDSAFDTAGKLIDSPLTHVQFYGIVAPIVSMIGDIHTTIEPSDECLSYLAARSDLFPFDIRVIDQNVFIASNNSYDTSVPVGSRIVKINNQTISEIMRKMESFFSDEGTNRTLKQKRIEQRFAFQYHLTYGCSKEFKLEYSVDNEHSITKNINAQPFWVVQENRKKNQLQYPRLKSLFAQPPYLSISVVEKKSVAILTIQSFQNDVIQSSNQEYKNFIDSVFTEIRNRKINNLIIDIRGNGGGESENASYLYSYLTNKPFRFLYTMEANRKIYNDDLKRGLTYKFVESTGKYRTTDSSTKYQQFFGLKIQKPLPNSFSGRLFVLIDGLTTSAATQFASFVKQNNRGALIGEDAPGSLYGGSGRGYSYFLLPNSELLTMISHYRLYLTNPARKVKDVCVSPDYKTVHAFQDKLHGIDKDLEYALKLISEAN